MAHDVSQKIIYKPSDLNKILLNETKNIANDYQKIYIVGDIKDYRKWKRSGCSFKLYLDNDSVDCKVWESIGLLPQDIEQFSNTRCIIKGGINADFFNGHRFSVNVESIKMQDNNTKLNELKKLCNQKNLFLNKKEINWNKVKNIGLVSKKNSQGYDDFCNQFKIPLKIHLSEITLEGSKTVKDCINSIIDLQDKCDIIFIVRGGGNTAEISNSFDNIDLFQIIKQSKIPIVTAIGHEQDKDDKLLITRVSDLNFSTPTCLAKDLNELFLGKLNNKIDSQIDILYEEFMNIIDKENEFLFQKLKLYLDKFIKSKFGGQIIKIEENEQFVIINKNDNFYKVEINYKEKLDFTPKEINYKTLLEDSFYKKSIDDIYKYLKLLEEDDKGKDIKNILIKLKENEKIEDKYMNCSKKKIDTYFLKQPKKIKYTKSNLLKLKRTLLLYKNLLETNNESEILKIFNYIEKYY